jgi:hypothetical protein
MNFPVFLLVFLEFVGHVIIKNDWKTEELVSMIRVIYGKLKHSGCLETRIELGHSEDYPLINHLGGLENLELSSNNVSVYGRKIGMDYYSSVLSDEDHVELCRMRYCVIARKLPESLVNVCIGYEIYPRFNHISDVKSWISGNGIPEHMWNSYSRDEQQILKSYGNYHSMTYKFQMWHRKDMHCISNYVWKN